jgi:hypothetical protein
MKALVLSLLLVSVQGMAAVELGKYRAVDFDTKTITADLLLRANATSSIIINTPDLPKPIPCEGKYNVEGKLLTANVKCKSDLLDEALVKIDITNVTPEGLRSEAGVKVNVTIDALGDESIAFILKKND